MAVEPADIEYGLSLLKGRQDRDRLHRDYFNGRYDMSFVPSEARSSLQRLLRKLGYNRCRTVIRALASRTVVTGWDTAGTGADPIVMKAEDLWRRNQMQRRQGEVTRESFRSGDGYVIVWPNAEGKVCFYPNPAHIITVVYDSEYPDHIHYAVKCWREERGPNKGKWRVTTYDESSVVRYISNGRTDAYPEKAGRLVPYTDDGQPETANTWGIVPVIHFPNQGDTGGYGTSELADVVGLQDGLNNSLVNMVYGEEFVSYPQKWVSGIEAEEDPITKQAIPPFRAGIDKVWYSTASEPLAQFGQFDPGDMTQFIVVQDSWDAKIARVSSVPQHWLNQSKVEDSGESKKTAEAPFVSKVRDGQLERTDPWASAQRLGLIQEGESPEAVETLEPVWMNPESRSDLDFWTTAALKRAIGIPESKIWAEFGYSQDEIDEMLAMNDAAKTEAATRFAQSFDRGEMDTEDDTTDDREEPAA